MLALRLLGGRPMHGYDLVRAIRLTTAGAIAFGEGCVYPVLHRLEAEGAVAARREPVGGRERVVYRLTPAGRKRLGTTAARWHAVTAAIAAALQGGGDAAPAMA